MVVGASITVNNSRNEGSIGSGGSSEDTKILKQILAQLKEMNKQTMVADRKASSGFGGAAGTRGILSQLLSLVGVTAVGAAASAVGSVGAVLPGSTSLAQGRRNQGVSYTKYQGEDGQQMIAQIENKTGDILDLMTLEEAQRKGIVDEAGRIAEWLVNQNTEAKSIFNQMERVGDIYMATEEQLQFIKENNEDIVGVTAEQLEWAKRARNAQKKLAEELEKKAKMGGAGALLSVIDRETRDTNNRNKGETNYNVIVGPNGSSTGNQNNQNLQDEERFSRDLAAPIYLGGGFSSNR